MKITITTLLYGTGTFIFFNCGMWQLWRRQWKMRVIELQQNLDVPEVHDLPPPGSPVPQLYTKVALKGYFDYSGSVLVGPRACPDLMEGKSGMSAQIVSATGSKKWGESQGGFFLFTPFRIATDDSLLMVNIGWVPVDACRSETHLQKYLRKTTNTLQTLRGWVRYEEDFGAFWNGYTDAYNKKIGMSWPLIRPAEIAKSYFDVVRQWKQTQNTVAENDLFLEETVAQPENSVQPVDSASPHLLRHYYITMFDEDDTSRIVINGEIFPKRSSQLYRQTYFVTPNTHLQYALFWFFASAMSARFLKISIDQAVRISRKQAAELKYAQRVRAVKSEPEVPK